MLGQNQLIKGNYGFFLKNLRSDGPWQGLWTEAYKNHVGPIFFFGIFFGDPIGMGKKPYKPKLPLEGPGNRGL